MNWERMGEYWMRSDGDYIISKARFGDVWCYTAWGPDIGEQAFKSQLKAQYKIGESVPSRRPRLGIYDDIEAAAASCESSEVA